MVIHALFCGNAASIFGEQRRLEPMSPERKARWRKEIDWLLSVTDHIVEFVPSTQKSQDGTNMEVISLSLGNGWFEKRTTISLLTNPD